MFQTLQNLWGPLELDLFASQLTNQLPHFVSWKPDPRAEAVDAFSLQRNIVKGYAFPPFYLLGRCLSQALRQQVPYLVLVAPVWKWVSPLAGSSSRLSSPYSSVSQSINLGGVFHPLTHLQLGGWLISGNSVRREAFHAKLESSSQQLGGKTPLTSMPLAGAL